MHPKMAPNLSGNAPEPISVLAVVTAKQAAKIERILSHTRWQLHVVHSIEEAMQVLQSLPISVVLCEHPLPDGTWLDVVRETEQLRPRPKTIVLSASVDSALWGEVLNCGGYDLLAIPLEPCEVYALVPMAWRQSNSSAEKTSASAELGPLRELATVS